MSVSGTDKCIGCTVCQEVCPKSAIKMEKNDKGFLYPAINKVLCNECSLCERYCIAKKNNVCKNRAIYIKGVKNKDEEVRFKSSSGGVFSAIAKYIIENEGVVYGVKLDENLHAVHDRAQTWEEIIPFMGSKYVESDMSNVLRLLEKDVKEGKYVLFTGTPCQCAALNKFIYEKKINSSKLIICDFLCHGSPSPKVFEDFKSFMENKYNGKITKFYFRDKEKYQQLNALLGRGIRMEIVTNSSVLDVFDSKSNNLYYELFKFNYLSRESCYNCDFIGFERTSDISMADYWGCEKYYKDFYDTKGISLLLINTDKGKEIYESIKNGFNDINVKERECFQKTLVKAPSKSNDYDKFWNMYKNKGFEITSKYFTRKYRRQEKIDKVKITIKKILPKRFISFFKK